MYFKVKRWLIMYYMVASTFFFNLGSISGVGAQLRVFEWKYVKIELVWTCQGNQVENIYEIWTIRHEDGGSSERLPPR